MAKHDATAVVERLATHRQAWIDAGIPYGYCLCGCGEKTRIATGTALRDHRIKGEPIRHIRGHNPRRTHLEYVEEDRGHKTPCWIWQRCMADGKYGRGERGAAAHRMMYERLVGPIPEGLQLDHLCRVQICVNPDHLEPVTLVENLRRGLGAKLNVAKVTEIRARPSERARDLATEFGVSEAAIHAVLARRTWKDVA